MAKLNQLKSFEESSTTGWENLSLIGRGLSHMAANMIVSGAITSDTVREYAIDHRAEEALRNERRAAARAKRKARMQREVKELTSEAKAIDDETQQWVDSLDPQPQPTPETK